MTSTFVRDIGLMKKQRELRQSQSLVEDLRGCEVSLGETMRTFLDAWNEMFWFYEGILSPRDLPSREYMWEGVERQATRLCNMSEQIRAIAHLGHQSFKTEQIKEEKAKKETE